MLPRVGLNIPTFSTGKLECISCRLGIYKNRDSLYVSICPTDKVLVPGSWE